MKRECKFYSFIWNWKIVHSWIFFNKNWKYLKIYTKETKKKVKPTAFVIKIISDLMFYLLNITIHEKGTLKPNTVYF